MKNLTSDRLLIPIAFGIIYIVWGSTYLANWFAIRDIPVFLMCGGRFLAAGIILFALSFLLGATWPKWEYWKNTALLGVLFFLVGNGGAVWALQYIDSGIEALIISAQPLIIVLMMWGMNGTKPTGKTLFGIGLGILGMALLVAQDKFMSDGNVLIGIGVILVCVLSWGYASVKISKIHLPESKAMSAGMQMMLGGAMLLSVGLLAGEAAAFDLDKITPRAAWSWLYLVVFGSIAAFSAFNYLLLKVAPDKVSTNTYVNPVIALLLGWSLNGEALTQQSLLAAALLLLGVVLINTRRDMIKKLLNKRPHPAAPFAQEAGSVKDVDIRKGRRKAGTIARIWQGQTAADKADQYLEMAKQVCVETAIATPGNLGVTVLHRTEGNITHHTFISYWKDLEAVKLFAGEEYGRPRIFVEEAGMLLESEGVVEHRTV